MYACLSPLWGMKCNYICPWEHFNISVCFRLIPYLTHTHTYFYLFHTLQHPKQIQKYHIKVKKHATTCHKTILLMLNQLLKKNKVSKSHTQTGHRWETATVAIECISLNCSILRKPTRGVLIIQCRTPVRWFHIRIIKWCPKSNCTIKSREDREESEEMAE